MKEEKARPLISCGGQSFGRTPITRDSEIMIQIRSEAERKTGEGTEKEKERSPPPPKHKSF